MIVGDASVAMIKAGSMTRDSYWDGNPGVGGFFVVLQDCWIVTLLRGRRARGKYRGSWEGRRGCLRTINRCWSRSWCRGRWNTGAFWWSTRCSVYTSRSIRRRICRGSSIYLRSADSDPWRRCRGRTSLWRRRTCSSGVSGTYYSCTVNSVLQQPQPTRRRWWQRRSTNNKRIEPFLTTRNKYNSEWAASHKFRPDEQ